jgi:hypothetical protein
MAKRASGSWRTARFSLGVFALALLSTPSRAEERTVEILPGVHVKVQVGQPAKKATAKPRKAASTKKPQGRKPTRKRPPPPEPPARREPPAMAHVPPAPPPAGADAECLQALGARGVSFNTVGPVEGVRTPVEVLGPIDGIKLISRGRRPALMDCELARALADAAPLFHQAQITGLSYSAAYDYRQMRGSTELSNHAHGLAIDVHAFETPAGLLDVQRDYPKGVGQWEGYGPARGRGVLEACVGAPPTPQGRTLRTLACSLNRHPDFNVILTPDDNYDHRNHFHIESYASRSALVGRSDRGRHGPPDEVQGRRARSR